MQKTEVPKVDYSKDKEDKPDQYLGWRFLCNPSASCLKPHQTSLSAKKFGCCRISYRNILRGKKRLKSVDLMLLEVRS